MFRKLFGVTLAALAITALACESESPISLDDRGDLELAASCDIVVPDDHPTIQAAVDAATAGDTICVESGTYTEQVVINKDLELLGINDPVIEAPPSPSVFTISESGASWEPVVFVFGGNEVIGAVSGSQTIQVSVSGFVVDGNDRNPTVKRASGFLLRNVEGDISDNVVRNMHVGEKQTFGIIVYGDSDLRIERNTVSEYERGGIGANGDGGSLPDPNALIRDNHVTGSTGIEVAWAPNGIQIGFGATGAITNNTVVDNRWSGTGWVASCILVFESDGVQIQRNTVENCDAGIGVSSWAWFLMSADDAKIDKNTIDSAFFGIVLQAVAWEGLSSSDPTVSNNKIIGNELADTDDIGEIGIVLSAVDLDPDFDPVVEDNKVINNDISGFDTAVFVDEDATDSKVHANDPATP